MNNTEIIHYENGMYIKFIKWTQFDEFSIRETWKYFWFFWQNKKLLLLNLIFNFIGTRFKY